MTGTSRDDIPLLLRRAGLRVTAARATILDLLRTEPHSDAESLARAARGRLGSVSTQAVYDTLHTLVRAGLARRIEPGDHPARFEARTGDNHHHIVCRDCGAVEDVDCVVGLAPCLEPDSTHGFEVDEAEVTFWGRCPACRTTAAEAGA
ncbi:Fur family transcriptional regulator [Yinghuangia seranimata]|uniref:Fur family transcriptional regulator n=1 Tax=Yinghuangia seranimata TaxID=408067 RepID=UPI00248D2689|nr:Fur family transcriptional regulator [Yinghuangia seranimata]MDI2131362.1 Fur family transcriptional regulator [Yinghuangia seranimata]